MTEATPRSGPSRRRFLGVALSAAGVAAAGGAGFGVARATEPSATEPTAPAPSDQVPFYGEHQAGIATPAQDRLAFAAFDITTTDVHAVQTVLGSWAAAAARMTAGEAIGPTETAPQAPPADTGEAFGLGPAQLTITVGFGPSFFDDRLGLARKRPAALADLPTFPGDALDPDRSHGDLASRHAQTTRRSRSTSSVTLPGSAAARWRCAGPSSGSGGPRRRRPRRKPHGTSWASRTGRTTSRPRTPPS